MFKIGDKVYLREDIWYNSTEESNPLNVLGVITGHGNMLPFKVDWENGEINVYAECDLMSEEEYLRHHASISQSGVNRFDLEQRIMECWAIVDDIKTLYELPDLREVSEDEMQNYLLGLQTIYQAKFELLWDTFEQMIKGG